MLPLRQRREKVVGRTEAGLAPFRNQILAGLSDDDLALVLPHLAPTSIKVGQVLEAPSQAIEYVYFPESGLASVLANDDRGQRIEVGPFGRDGMSGSPIVLGVDHSAHETLVQVAGTAHRIHTATVLDLIGNSPTLQSRFLRYIHAFASQTASTVLANARFGLEARLARWLVMIHDRIDGDLLITHDFLSVILGVRRAGVTTAMHVLEGEHLIRTARGKVSILDRDGLIRLARGSYGRAEAEYARVLGLTSVPSAL